MITPRDVQGHWVRDWIKAPGFEDHTTRVHWMQAGPDYADVRVPFDRPDLGAARCLAELDASSLLALAQVEGFAGHVTLDGDTCTWHREVNWHGTPDAPDIGAISFDTKGRMIEAGILTEYTELWEQHAKVATTALRFGDGTYSGLLVTAGDVGVVGIGREAKLASKPILEALKEGHVPDDAHLLFDGMHALCQISEGAVIATLATTPFVEGTPILTLSDYAVTWHQADFDGAQTDKSFQLETVPA